MYSMVPEGNAVWHNPNVNKFGKGLTRVNGSPRP